MKSMQENCGVFGLYSKRECVYDIYRGIDFFQHRGQENIKVKGSYSLVVLTRDGIYAARDIYGFRPLILGMDSERYE